MGDALAYKCPKCNHEAFLKMGIGFVCPNPAEIEDDIKNGLYGDKAKAFLVEHPDYFMNASLEIYQCKCGNIQNEYHIVLKVDNAKSFSNRQHCIRCGSVMKKLNEPPEEIPCPECGASMAGDIVGKILWD